MNPGFGRYSAAEGCHASGESSNETEDCHIWQGVEKTERQSCETCF